MVFTSNRLAGSVVGEYLWLKGRENTAIEDISLFKLVFVSSAHFVNHSIPTDFRFGPENLTAFISFCILTLARFLDRARLDCQQPTVVSQGFSILIEKFQRLEGLTAHPK